MRFEIKIDEDGKYGMELNEERIADSIGLDEVLTKIKKIMEALNDGKSKDKTGKKE